MPACLAAAAAEASPEAKMPRMLMAQPSPRLPADGVVGGLLVELNVGVDAPDAGVLPKIGPQAQRLAK